MRADLTKVRQALFNLHEQRREVHRERHDHVGRTARGSGDAALIVFSVWIPASASPREARHDLRGILAGRRHDHAQLRRHRSGPADQPPLLSDDGRRHLQSAAAPARAPPSRSGCRPRSTPWRRPAATPARLNRKRRRTTGQNQSLRSRTTARSCWSSMTTATSGNCCRGGSFEKAIRLRLQPAERKAWRLPGSVSPRRSLWIS